MIEVLLETITERFFIYAMLVMVIISFASGMLGSFMIWQRLAYLGDSISHSALLGVAMSIIFNINTSFSIMIIALVFAFILSFDLTKFYSVDTILNVVTNVVLALGLVLLSLFPYENINVMYSLFGDLLTVTVKDIVLIALISVATIIMFFSLKYTYWYLLLSWQ